MYVSVAYRMNDRGFRGQEQAFSPRTYTYITNLPLAVGDMVIAPTKFGEQPAIVREIDLEAPAFECKEITVRLPENMQNAHITMTLDEAAKEVEREDNHAEG